MSWPLVSTIALSAALALLPFPGAAQAPSARSPEGLEPVRVAGLENVYARPGASLAGYDAILLDPIEVSFARDWDPKPAGQPITAQERERIRRELAQILREEFIRELENRGQYSVVQTTGENVLRIRPEIRDLYISAPDVDRAARIDQYTLSLGEMTLVAELRDSVSGTLIARVVDRRTDPERLFLERTTRVDNVAAARRAGRRWAEILHRQLDAARSSIGAGAGAGSDANLRREADAAPGSARPRG